jgi:hypothetical protein
LAQNNNITIPHRENCAKQQGEKITIMSNEIENVDGLGNQMPNDDKTMYRNAIVP